MVFLAFYVSFMQFFAYPNTNFSFIIGYCVFYRLYLCAYYLNFAFCGGLSCTKPIQEHSSRKIMILAPLQWISAWI